jgi:hypothetical protein
MAPQHRQSLGLKWHELRAAGSTDVVEVLDGISGLPVMDILDEVDELLHHR